jgi:hypothetical protein
MEATVEVESTLTGSHHRKYRKVINVRRNDIDEKPRAIVTIGPWEMLYVLYGSDTKTRPKMILVKKRGLMIIKLPHHISQMAYEAVRLFLNPNGFERRPTDDEDVLKKRRIFGNWARRSNSLRKNGGRRKK